MELSELVAREQIRDTIARYSHAGDRGLAEELAQQFLPDGVLEENSVGRLIGRAAIAGFISAIAEGYGSATTIEPPMVRHHVSNVCIAKLTHDRAQADSYFVVYGRHGVDHWGRYRDTLVPYEGRWLFEHRLVRVDAWVQAGMHAAWMSRQMSRNEGAGNE